MYKTQYEMDWGTEEDNVLLPNSLRVSTWILTKLVLETDHQFSKKVPPGQPAVHCQALANADSGRAGSPL